MGKPCVIPWYQGSNTNYFCLATFQCMPNQPDSNTTAYCQRGRFLWGRPNSVGDAYFGQLIIPEINLGAPGRYEISYWVAFSCEGAGCTSSGDSIKMMINDDSENRAEGVTNLDNIGFIKRWMPKSFQFSVTDPIIEVLNHSELFFTLIYIKIKKSYYQLKVQFQRLVKQTQIAYFALDQIEITRLGGDIETSPAIVITTTTEELETTTTVTEEPTTTTEADETTTTTEADKTTTTTELDETTTITTTEDPTTTTEEPTTTTEEPTTTTEEPTTTTEEPTTTTEEPTTTTEEPTTTTESNEPTTTLTTGLSLNYNLINKKINRSFFSLLRSQGTGSSTPAFHMQFLYSLATLCRTY